MNQSLKNFVGQLIVCLLIAINTYPATQNIIADLSGAQVSAVPICTMTGIKYVSADISQNSDVEQKALQSMENCPFCQGYFLVFIPPTNQNSLGNITAYSERFKIDQYRHVYYKTTISRPQTRGPPIIFFV